jgi:hypothetical protein
VSLFAGTLACAGPLAGAASAQTVVGTVTACYYSAECTYTSAAGFSGVVDGPAASKKLGVVRDTYKIGKILPGGSAVIVVGASNDGQSRPNTTYFFYYNGPQDARDTSDVGPNASAIVFKFAGKLDGAAVTSGRIVTGASAGPSVDGTVALLNFLGGPGNADGPCNDCFAPKVIANIVTVPQG